MVDPWHARTAALQPHQRAELEQPHRAVSLRTIGLQCLGDVVVGVQPPADEADAAQGTQMEVAERHGIGVAERATADLGRRPSADTGDLT